MPVVEVNGVALNYREMGSRDHPTLVLAHTILFGPELFDHLVSELANDYHLVVLDLHGHGKSGYRTPLILEEMAEDCYQLLTMLSLAGVTWVGYSMGGMLAMRVALEHPEMITSLILIATTARKDPPQLAETTGQLWDLLRDGHREDIVDAALQYFLSPATYATQPDLAKSFRDRVVGMEDVAGEYAAAQAVINRTDISERIAAISVPTLVLAGKDDIGGAAPPESELIAARIPDARLVILDDVSHLLAVENPREVGRLVREFLTTQQQTAAPT